MSIWSAELRADKNIRARNQVILMNFTVAEALPNDVGRGALRISAEVRKKLDISLGEIVEIKGKRLTLGLALVDLPKEDPLDIVRMDGYVRANAGVSLGDVVIIKKTELAHANKVILSPTQPMKYSPGFDSFVKGKLLGRGVVQGDTEGTA